MRRFVSLSSSAGRAVRRPADDPTGRLMSLVAHWRPSVRRNIRDQLDRLGVAETLAASRRSCPTGPSEPDVQERREPVSGRPRRSGRPDPHPYAPAAGSGHIVTTPPLPGGGPVASAGPDLPPAFSAPTEADATTNVQ